MGSKGDDFCKLCGLLAAVLLIMSVIGNSYLVYLYTNSTTKLPLTPADVLVEFNDCTHCPVCLTCLTDVTGEDNNAICDPYQAIENMYQCTEQLIHLYDQNDYGQPCYSDCNKCQKCLQKTTLDQPVKHPTTMWEIVYPDLFASPEDMGITRRKKRVTEIVANDMCCETVANPIPYQLDIPESGKTWHPVWINPSGRNNDVKYQFYYHATCQTDFAQCGQFACTTSDTVRSFLFTTMNPFGTFGYAYHLFTLRGRNPWVKFMSVDVAGYCRCVTVPI